MKRRRERRDEEKQAREVVKERRAGKGESTFETAEYLATGFDEAWQR